MAKHHYDIVIVGGGLVGTTLAASLANTQYRIVLIEAHASTQHEKTTKDLRALALSYGSQQIFDRLHIWEKLSSITTPIKKIHVSEQKHFGNTLLSSEEINLEAFGFVTPIQLLYDELQNHLSHIDILRPAKVSAVKKQDNGWELIVNEKSIQTTLLIAADGERSFIRNTLQIPTEEKDFQQTAIVSNCAISKPHELTAYERFTPNGILAMMPLQNERAAIIFTVPNDPAKTYLEISDDAFLDEIQNAFGYRLGKLSDLGKRQSYPLRQIHAKKQTLPGFVLLGNAAHTLNPIASQGFNLCLRDVQVLSKLLSKTKDLSDPALLESYIQLREPDQKETLTFTKRLTNTFKPQGIPFSPLRAMGLFFFDLCPFAKNSFEWKRAKANLMSDLSI